MATRCILCCHPVTPDQQTSTLDQRLFYCLCKTLKTSGPNSFQTVLTENPVCSSCLDLLRTADDTLKKLEELELKIGDIAEDLKCILKRGYSTLQESRGIQGQELEFLANDVQNFLFEAAGVHTGEDYIEIVPLSHDGLECYDDDDVSQQELFSPLNTGLSNEDGDDGIEVIQTEKSDAVQLQEVQSSNETSGNRSKSDIIYETGKPSEDYEVKAASREAAFDVTKEHSYAMSGGTQTLGGEPKSKDSGTRRRGAKSCNSAQLKKHYCCYNECLKIFESAKALRAHMLEPHDVEILNTNLEFSCKKCRQFFPTYVDMLTHLTSEHAAEANPQLVSLFCQKCGNDFVGVTELRAHLKHHPRKKVYLCSCSHCGKCFIKKSFLRRHEPMCPKIKTKRIWSCRTCQKPFWKWRLYRKHMVGFNLCVLAKHKENEKFVCRGCMQSFQKRKLLKKHYKNCKDERPRRRLCPYQGCSRSFTGELMLHVHLSKPHEVKIPDDGSGKRPYFCCHVCKKLFLSYGILAEHIKQDHPTESPPPHLTCQFCARSYKNTKFLRAHLKYHAGHLFICETCGKTYRNNGCLWSHLRISSCGSRPNRNYHPHVCEGCSKSFKYETGLQKHRKAGCPAETKGPEDLRCKLCGKDYPNYDALRIHKYTHTNKTRITCEVCQKIFRSKAEFIRHRRSHFPEEKLSCHLCQAKFAIERNLRDHINLKHFGKGRKCPHCDYVCSARYTFECHLRIHTGEKPFMCDICGMTFRSTALMKSHRRYHGGKPYKCEMCGREFMRRHVYEGHLKTHTNPQLHWKVRQKLEREAAKKLHSK